MSDTRLDDLVSAGPDGSASILRARDGCEVARAELLSAACSYLQALAARSIDPQMNRHLSASDVIQETLLDAHRGLHSFEGSDPAQLRAWLRQIFVNNLANQFRRFHGTQKRDATRELSGVPLERLASESTETPSRVAIQSEDARRLHAALEALPDMYRRVIILRHQEHLTFPEIAKRLGKSPDAVRMTWYRAFSELSRELAESPQPVRR